jgi:flavodoxin
MKALILFRSFHGNTGRVAEAMARQFKTLGHEAAVQDVRLKLPDLSGIDVVLVGAPTRMGQVTRRAIEALKNLKKKGFGSKPVAVFDTCGILPKSPEKREKFKSFFEPGAVGILRKAAQQQGLNLYPEILRCEVIGMKGPLADNAIAKATAFAGALAAFVRKR